VLCVSIQNRGNDSVGREFLGFHVGLEAVISQDLGGNWTNAGEPQISQPLAEQAANRSSDSRASYRHPIDFSGVQSTLDFSIQHSHIVALIGDDLLDDTASFA